MSFATSPWATSPWATRGPTAANPVIVTAARAPRLVFGDYVIDDDGNISDAPDYIDEEVAWRLQTQAGSFAGGATIGNGVFRVQSMTSRTVVEVRSEVENALRPMIDRGVIRDLDVSPEPFVNGGVAINFFRVGFVKTGLRER